MEVLVGAMGQREEDFLSSTTQQLFRDWKMERLAEGTSHHAFTKNNIIISKKKHHQVQRS